MPGETEETRKRFKSKPSKSRSTPMKSGQKMAKDGPRERGQSTTKKEIKKVQKAVKEAAKEDRTAQAYVDRWSDETRSVKAAEEFKPTSTQREDLQKVKTGLAGTSVALTGYAKKKAFLDARKKSGLKKGDAGYETLEEWIDSLSKRDRQRVQAADRAGLFGGGVRGDIEAFQRGTDQSEYQMMMDRMRTGELGPAMQTWYKDEFPWAYGIQRGLDIAQQPGGIYKALWSELPFGGEKGELLPYDKRKEWFEALNRKPIDPYGERTLASDWSFEGDVSPDWDITPYQQYKLQSQIQERGGFTGGPGEKLKYAKQMGIVPLDTTEDQFSYTIGSEGQFDRSLFPHSTPEEIAKYSMLKQPTKSEWHEYLDERGEFSPTPIEGGILQSPEAIAAYKRAKRLYDMGADPVTGGARMDLPESTQQITYGTGGGVTTPPDTTPPGDENQWATAGAGQIGYWNPATGQYEWGTMGDYLPLAQVKDGGIIGLDGGGYIDDYQAANSLMFKDPQDDEEWEYNV